MNLYPVECKLQNAEEHERVFPRNFKSPDVFPEAVSDVPHDMNRDVYIALVAVSFVLPGASRGSIRVAPAAVNVESVIAPRL